MRKADHGEHGAYGDDGLSTIEVVILAPVMILFILILVAFGQLVNGRSAVDSAARDAARAGSLQHDGASAMAQAREAATADLQDICVGTPKLRKTSGAFESGELFTVEVTCQVRGLALIGLDIGTDISGTSSSPIDPYRRTA